MGSFGEKAKIKKAGNLNYGHSYDITTVSQVWQSLIRKIKPNFKRYQIIL